MQPYSQVRVGALFLYCKLEVIPREAEVWLLGIDSYFWG